MTVRCNKRSDLEAPDIHNEPAKRWSKKACLKCNERDGVLVCNSPGCPIIVHKDCMSCAAHFDDGGNFYCPYCAYKCSLDECREAKESIIFAKKALVSFLDTKVVRSTGDVQIAKTLMRERPEGIEFTFQHDILRNGLAMKLEVRKKPDVIGGVQSGRVGEYGEARIREKSLKDDMMDNVMQMELKSQNLKTKRWKIAVEVEGNCNGGVHMKETQREPHGMVEKNEGFDIPGLNPRQAVETTKLEDGRARGNFQWSVEMPRDQTTDAILLQDEYTSSEQLKLNSETGDGFAEIQKDHCNDAKNMVRSPKHSACHTRKHDASVTHKESGYFSRKNEGTKDTEEACYEAMEEKKQQQVEPSIYLSRKDDLIVTNKTSGKGDVNAFRVTLNFEDTGFEEHFSGRTDEQQTLVKSVKDGTHGSRNLATENKQNIDAMDGNNDGPPKKGHKRTEPLEPSKENAEVTNEKAKEVNYSVHDEYLSRSCIAVNKNDTGQTSDIGDIHCERADEGGKQIKLQKDVISTRKENVGVSYKEFDTEDEQKSSQESHHMRYGLRSKEKSRVSAHSKIGNQPRKSSGSSESDLEEYEEATCVKSRQKLDSLKQIQHTPISVGRRKKLPWTIEEEETLKEGVEKFSLTAKKNVPWIKILEFGSHIFDGTRTPDDLKDKWKRTLTKAHENA